MSLADFDALTPDEFNAIAAARMEQERSAWERVRLLGTIILQPYVSKGARLTPEKVIHFPWDDENPGSTEPQPEQMTIEQRRKRAEQLLKNG